MKKLFIKTIKLLLRYFRIDIVCYQAPDSTSPVNTLFAKLKMSEDASDWCFSSLEKVKQNVFSTSYPKAKTHFIKGKVVDAIPSCMPRKISLLGLGMNQQNMS